MSSYRKPQAPGITVADMAWIAGILLLAVALRAYKLDASLWFDEIETVIKYLHIPTSQLLVTYENLNNHMFHSLQAQLSVALFGETPWTIRLPAMLFGVASIWALWRLCHEILSPWEARFAALLMAVSYHHVWFSQNARGYTGLLFFALVATWLLIRALRDPNWRVWVWFGLCLALSMYTHLTAAFFFLAAGIAYLLVVAWRAVNPSAKPLPPLWMPILGCAFGVGVTLILYAPLIGQMVAAFTEVSVGEEPAAYAESIAQWDSPLWMVSEIVASMGPVGVLLPGVLVVAAVGVVSLWRTVPLVPLILLIHVPVTIGLLVAFEFRVWPRYFLTDIGLIILLLVHGAFVLGRWAAGFGFVPTALKGERLAIVFAAVGIAATLVLLPRNYLYPKQDYAGVTAYVEENRAPESLVIAIGRGSYPFTSYMAPHWERAETLEAFQALRKPGVETWLVFTFPNVIPERHADIFKAAGPDFEKAAYFPGTLSDGGFVVLRSPDG